MTANSDGGRSMITSMPGRRAALVPYLVAGHPTMPICEAAVDALVEEGAAALELGVPYSDALADGPVIQAASESAAANVGLRDVFALARRIRARHPRLPLVLFTYFNPICRLGVEVFAREAGAAGVEAVLVVDLPLEEADAYRAALAAHGLKSVFLVSPTTTAERARRLAEASTGFVYYVSRTGVTGESATVSATLREEIARLRGATDRPIAIGFGVSTPDQARAVAELGDAVVVGSAFVRAIGRGVPAVRTLARDLVGALAIPRGGDHG